MCNVPDKSPEVFYVVLSRSPLTWASGGSSILVRTLLPQDSLVMASAGAGLKGRIDRRYTLVAGQILERGTPESHTHSPMLSH